MWLLHAQAQTESPTKTQGRVSSEASNNKDKNSNNNNCELPCFHIQDQQEQKQDQQEQNTLTVHGVIGLQTRSEVSVGAVDSYCEPDTQTVRSWHSRSRTAEGAVVWNWLLAHCVQAAQACWFAEDWKVPSAQSAQARSDVAVAALDTRVPGGHVVSAVHTRSPSCWQGLLSNVLMGSHVLHGRHSWSVALPKVEAGHCSSHVPEAVKKREPSHAVHAPASLGAEHSAHEPSQAWHSLSSVFSAVPGGQLLTHLPRWLKPTRDSAREAGQAVQPSDPLVSQSAQLAWQASHDASCVSVHTPAR